MLDIALVWNNALGEADLALVNGDLATDPGLETAVIISLFSDRLASPGDRLPGGGTDRRGFWGDMPVDPGEQDIAPTGPALTGSRLWLLDRALQTQSTLNLAETYAEEALAWLVSDGVAGSVSASASYPAPGQIQLVVTLAQAGGARQFRFLWGLSPDLPPVVSGAPLVFG